MEIGTSVKVTQRAIADHQVPHYNGKVGKVIDVLDDGFCRVLWQYSWTSIWHGDELEVLPS